jgi:hypothetical protein
MKRINRKEINKKSENQPNQLNLREKKLHADLADQADKMKILLVEFQIKK